MTVTVFDRRLEYPGNDAATVFDGPRAFLLADLSAFLTDDTTAEVTALAEGADYTVTGLMLENTVFTLAVAPPAGKTLTLLRTLEYTNETRFTNQGAFFAALHEDEFDRTAMRDQQLADLIAEQRADWDAVNLDLIITYTDQIISILADLTDLTDRIELLEAAANARQQSFILDMSDTTTAIIAGVKQARFVMPYNFVPINVAIDLGTAQTSGAIVTVDCKMDGVSILTVLASIANAAKKSDSDTGVIGTAHLSGDMPTGGYYIPAGTEITFDTTQVGDGTAKWLQVTLRGYQHVPTPGA